MTLYVRADVASVSVPASSGGCGFPHVRPVEAGVPVHKTVTGELAPWPITCPACEANLSEDIKRSGMKKVRTVNADAGLKLADRYLGLFGSTPETVPESPDEEKRREYIEQKTATEHAARQVDAATETAASMHSIASAIQGNSELMTKFMEFQAALIAQHQPPAEMKLPGPTAAGVTASTDTPAITATCRDCGSEFPRTSNKGPAPRRCPDCKAKAAA